ncbi:MAG: hypothetical protein PF440_04690 [Thiomicrorhabdus sp.]|jgi:hypothetical protein|nr:hypothetical protein [Thiomicrorhabdus sp.]
MPDKWGRVTGDDWLNLSNTLGSLQSSIRQNKTSKLQNQAFQLQIDDAKSQKNIQNLTGIAVMALAAGGTLPAKQPGTSAYEYNMSNAAAAQLHLQNKQVKADTIKADKDKAAIEFKEIKVLQQELLISQRAGKVGEVHTIVEKMSELMNVPLNAKWNDANQNFDKNYKHSGSDSWKKTGTVEYGEIVPKFASLTFDKFVVLSSAARQANRQYNAEAWGMQGVTEGGRTQRLIRNGKEYLVTPQRNPNNQNEVHYMVTGDDITPVRFKSKKDLVMSGFRYEDLKRDIDKEKISLSKLQQTESRAKTAKANRPDKTDKNRSSTGDVTGATTSMINNAKNKLGSIKGVSVGRDKGLVGEDVKSITAIIQPGRLVDVKKSLGNKYYFNMINEEEMEYEIIPKQKNIQQLATSFANETSEGLDDVSMVESVLDSNLKSPPKVKNILTDIEQNSLDKIRKNIPSDKERDPNRVSAFVPAKDSLIAKTGRKALETITGGKTKDSEITKDLQSMKPKKLAQLKHAIKTKLKNGTFLNRYEKQVAKILKLN